MNPSWSAAYVTVCQRRSQPSAAISVTYSTSTDIKFSDKLKGTVAVWGRNIFDNKDPTFTAYLGPFTGATYERARTFGVDLSAEF